MIVCWLLIKLHEHNITINNLHSTYTIMSFTLLNCNYSKDVRLPVQMQRAMAAEAESTREARAKVK